MQITFRRLDPKSHEVTVVRADGTTESLTAETRSLLPHDLAHLAVEAELGTVDGYFGRVAAGASIEGTWPDDDRTDRLMAIEGLAARVQSLWSAGTPVDRWPDEVARAAVEVDVQARPSEVVLAGIHERLRRLHGHWNATPFGRPMTVDWV